MRTLRWPLNRTKPVSLLVALNQSAWLPALVFTISLVFSVLLWLALPPRLQPTINGDYPDFYLPVAYHLLEGQGLIDGEARPAVRYPPGYPVLLAAVFAISKVLHISEDTGLLAFIFLCRAVTSTLIFVIARFIWRPLLAVAAACIWITYPLDSWIALQRGSETAFLVVFLGGLTVFWYGILRSRFIYQAVFLSGILVGMSMLIRPIAVGLGLVLSVIVWFAMANTVIRKRVLLVTVLLLGNILIVLPWQVWMYANTNEVSLLSTGGTGSIFDGLTYAVNVSKGYRAEIGVSDEVRMVQEAILKESEALETTGDMVRTLARQFEVRPWGVLELYASKAMRSWYASDSGRLERVSVVLQAPYLLVATVAFWKGLRQGGPVGRMVMGHGLIILYFWAMTTFVLSVVRYMMPAMGLLCSLLPGVFSMKEDSGGVRLPARSPDRAGGTDRRRGVHLPDASPPQINAEQI